MFRRKTCEYCGNNPVIHPISYINQSVALWMAPFDDWFMNSRLGYLLRRWFSWFHRFMIGSMRLVGIARFYSDKAKVPSKRGEVLWEEAVRRGMRIEGVSLYGKPLDMYRVWLRETPLMFMSLPRKEKPRIMTRIDDKAYLKELLRDAGVPTPPGGSVKTVRDALHLFEILKKPVIVKPRLGSRGRHTTTNIQTKEDLLRALKVAKRICNHVVIEEHLYGSVYRGTVIGGKLCGVLQGDPPRVVGDGVSTIARLIDRKNASRDPRISEIVVTPLIDTFLARQGQTLDSVLPQGKELDLSEKVGIGYGGSSRELFDETHPEVKTVLEKAASILGDDILGFDFIMEDPTKNPEQQTWGIIECNTVPFINLHHFPIHGTPRNVAAAVWDLWKQDIAPHADR